MEPSTNTTTPRPYSCTQCPKAFTRASTLRDHERTHSGERPFVCGFCKSAFTRINDLKVHERRHWREERFTCRGHEDDCPVERCGKTFSRKTSLLRHTRAQAKLAIPLQQLHGLSVDGDPPTHAGGLQAPKGAMYPNTASTIDSTDLQNTFGADDEGFGTTKAVAVTLGSPSPPSQCSSLDEALNLDDSGDFKIRRHIWSIRNADHDCHMPITTDLQQFIWRKTAPFLHKLFELPGCYNDVWELTNLPRFMESGLVFELWTAIAYQHMALIRQINLAEAKLLKHQALKYRLLAERTRDRIVLLSDRNKGRPLFERDRCVLALAHVFVCFYWLFDSETALRSVVDRKLNDFTLDTISHCLVSLDELQWEAGYFDGTEPPSTEVEDHRQLAEMTSTGLRKLLMHNGIDLPRAFDDDQAIIENVQRQKWILDTLGYRGRSQ